MSNIIKLNSYTKGRSIIKGSFLVSTDDPSNCLVTTKTTTPQNEFIGEGIPPPDDNRLSVCCVNGYFSEFGTPSDPPKFYRTKTTIYNYNWTGDDGYLNLSVSGNSMYVETCVDGELQMTCSGSASSIATEYNPGPGSSGPANCNGSFVDCVWQQGGTRCVGWGTNPNGPSYVNQTETIVSTTKIEITQPPWYIMSGTGTGTIELSDECVLY